MYTRTATYSPDVVFFFESKEKNASASKKCKDYSTGGMLMPGRQFNAADYRYGYNKGSEKDDEITGVTGAHITTFHREGDTRAEFWWSPDPVFNPSESPYSWMNRNPIMYNDPMGDCEDCPKEGGLKLNYSLGGGGFSASLYAGISTQNNFAMAGLNASATFYRGGAGTSKSSPNLFNLTLSPSLTFGGGTAAPMSLNLFNGMSGTGVNNTFKNSFTFGGNMVFSTGTNSDGSGRSQWLGAASFRLGNFSMGSYNDTWKPPLFMGQGSDQFWSAGLNAQIQNGDYNLSWSNDMYYGMSNDDATWSDDRIINGQNYDNQRLFDVMLNNGRENITLSSGRFGIMQSGTRSGYQTFYPSNTMHNNMHYMDKPTGQVHSFHHLYVPYPNTQQRLIPYLNGKTP